MRLASSSSSSSPPSSSLRSSSSGGGGGGGGVDFSASSPSGGGGGGGGSSPRASGESKCSGWWWQVLVAQRILLFENSHSPPPPPPLIPPSPLCTSPHPFSSPRHGGFAAHSVGPVVGKSVWGRTLEVPSLATPATTSMSSSSSRHVSSGGVAAEPLHQRSTGGNGAIANLLNLRSQVCVWAPSHILSSSFRFASFRSLYFDMIMTG